MIAIPPEPGFNVEIANLLLVAFFQLLGHLRVRGHGLELEVWGEPRNRFPDLAVVLEEHVNLLKQRNTIRLSMPPPMLVVEIVSPGEVQRNRDYVAKRMQYQDLGVLEYWIVNPQNASILILSLENGVYTEAATLQDEQEVNSTQFGSLDLRVADLFAGC